MSERREVYYEEHWSRKVAAVFEMIVMVIFGGIALMVPLSIVVVIVLMIWEAVAGG